MDTLFSWFVHNMNSAVHALCQVLPQSPFSRFVDLAERVPILGLLNYFVPITAYVDILLAWVAVMGVHYSRAVILRWLKIIS